MYLTLIIGGTGQGKSPFVKKMIEGKRCFVYDINNEWGSRTKYPGQQAANLSDDINAPRARYTGAKPSEFVKLCMEKTDTNCVLEDATAFFRGSQNQETMLMITRKLFNRNNYIFVFHSINRVPPFFMELANFVVLFKTADQVQNIKGKYASLLPHFLQMQRAPKGSYLVVKLIEQ